MPIRLRLALVSAGLIAILLILLGGLLYLQLRTSLLDAVDAGLRPRAAALVQASSAEVEAGAQVLDPEDAFAQVVERSGDLVASSPVLGDQLLLSPEQLGQLRTASFYDSEVHIDEEIVPARLLAVLDSSTDRVVVVGASLEDQRDALTGLGTLLLAGGPVAVALAGAVGWVLAGVALRPVERMRLEAEAVSGAEPGRRLSVPPAEDELSRLAGSLNRMLDRLEQAMETERRFVDDASHELRTPLTNLRAELELALRRARTPDELTAALRSAAEETEHLTRLAEDLLVLARSDRGRLAIHREPVDTTRLLEETTASFQGRAEQAGIALSVKASPGSRVSVDPMRLRQAVGNLIDNALQATPRGGHVDVEQHIVDGPPGAAELSITVTDSGPGFPPDFLSRAFEPFSRANEARARSDGAGLGLTIVAAVADAHGGTVTASAAANGGAAVTIRLTG
jgi:heavy metal sensor kinase